MENGTLVISLDFELLWGVFDKIDWREKKEYFQNTRELIPEILRLFEKYEISCTWAIVGMLFNENWDEWNQNLPEVIPKYKNKQLSAYEFGKSIQNKETERICFAPDLIKRIKEFPNQEIATHTYSHYYCLEPGQSLESFRSDLIKSVALASKFKIDINSLVFPRNQFNPNYLQVCFETGISNVRSNPDNWYWDNPNRNSLIHKVFRTGDAYLGINDKSYLKSGIKEIRGGMTIQKSSRLVKPFSGVEIIDKLKMNRIKNEMSKAAKNSEIYHLWWHPHNYAGNPEKCLEELKYILEHFKECQLKYNMKSFNMQKMGSFKNFNNFI